MLPLVVLYNGTDGARFVAERPPVRAICALSPIAAVAVRDLGLPVLDAGDRYRDCAHARTILRRERLRREWRAAVPVSNMPNSAEWYVLDLALVTLLHGYDRLRYVIGKTGPWLVPDVNRWTIHQRRDEACLAICRHILSHYWNFVGNVVCNPPPLAAFYRLLRKVLLLFAHRTRPKWATTRSDHPLGLEQALIATWPRARQWHFATTDAGWHEYLRLVREMWRALSGATQIQVRTVPLGPQESEQRAMAAIEMLPDTEIRGLLREFSPRIRELCGITGGIHRDFGDILRRLRPDFMLSSEIADSLTAALFEACGDLGIPRCIASHNNFAPVIGRINLIALRNQMGHQYANGVAEQMLFWTPSALAAAKQAFPTTENCCAGITVAVPSTPRIPQPGKPFHVLHASNCLRYFSPPTWLYEDVNELVAGAVALINAGLSVENTTYMIRSKSRRYEMDEHTFRAMLPPSDRVEIAFRHTRPFKDDLARADLLVAFRSTTIMQALYERKPVLLWGISPRYREFSGRSTPPRGENRAAVYSVRRAEDLPVMLAAIRDAHHGRPLSDEELAPYIFPPGTLTREAWASNCSTSPSG